MIARNRIVAEGPAPFRAAALSGRYADEKYVRSFRVEISTAALSPYSRGAYSGLSWTKPMGGPAQD